jgi:hypothetical protein
MVSVSGMSGMCIGMIHGLLDNGNRRELCHTRLKSGDELILGGIVKGILKISFDLAASRGLMVKIPPHRARERFCNRQYIPIAKLCLDLAQVHHPVVPCRGERHKRLYTARDGAR